MPLLLLAAGPGQTPVGRGLELFGIKFVGINPENGQKLLVTVIAITVFLLVRWVLRALVRLIPAGS